MYLANGFGRVSRVVHHATSPDTVKGVVGEREVKYVGSVHCLGPITRYFKVALRYVYRGLCQIRSGDSHAALEELQSVEAHSAADLENVLALQKRGLPFDPGHDLWKFVRIHPWPDMGEERGRANPQIGGLYVLKAERVPFPVILDGRQRHIPPWKSGRSA